MHIESVDAFTNWLVKELTPICDAEPGALAKYVLALLRKPDKSEDEIREFSTGQLVVFLQGSTKKFVEKVFSVLKDNSYIPKKEPTPMKDEKVQSRDKEKKDDPKKNGKDHETKAMSSREVKVNERERDDNRRRAPLVSTLNDKRERREEPRREDVPPPPRVERPLRKRISPPPTDSKEKREMRDAQHPRRRSRSPRERRSRGLGVRRSPGERHRGDRRRSRSRSRSRSLERERRDRKSDDDRRKRRCRDFDERGYCMLGDQCIYDHGPDPVIVDDSALEKIVKIPGPKPPAPNFSVPPPGYNPMNPPPPGVDGVFAAPPPASGPVEGYNPEAPALSGPDFSMPPPPLPMHINNTAWRATPYTVPTSANVVVPTVGYDPSGGVPVDPSSAGGPAVRGVGVRGRGRGTTTRYANQGNRGDGKTLQVRKIPPEHNNIAKLNEHFALFGNIVNMQVRFNGDPEAALITFSSRHEAMSAYKSPTPVLNNRFIKVFWHSTDTSQEVGQSAKTSYNSQGGIQRTVLVSGVHVEKPNSTTVESSEKPKVASVHESKFVNPIVQGVREKVADAKRKIKKEKADQMSLLDLQKRKMDLLQKLMDQQKIVLAKMRSDAIPKAEKKKMMAIIKDLLDKIKTCKKEVDELSEKLNSYNTIFADLEAIILSGKSVGGDAADSKDIDGIDGERESVSPLEGTIEVVATRNLLKRKFSECEEDDSVDAKRRGIVTVKGFEVEDEQELIQHMEQFGDLIDMDLVPGSRPPLATFTFKKYEAAERAVNSCSMFKGIALDLTWQRVRAGADSDVIPDVNRPKEQQMTADQILASIPQSESDDDQ